MAGRRRTWRERFALHGPRFGLAWRTAVAAAIALTVAVSLPEPWRSHAAYAPLGAVMSTSFSVRGSAVQAARAMLGLVLGLALGLIVIRGLGHGTAAVIVVVVVGVAIGGWRLLGSVGTWVPTMGLFVILAAGSDPVGFAMSNSVLALVGAVLGALVLLAVPITPSAAARLALRDLRDVLSQRLDVVADNLEGVRLPTTPDWQGGLPDLTDPLWRARSEVHAMTLASRANWRSRLSRAGALRYDVEGAGRQLKALERVSVLVDDLVLTVADRERQDADPDIWPGLGGPTREATARAVRAMARVLRSGGSGDADPDELAEADSAAEALQRCVEPADGASTSSAGMTVAHSIRRALWILGDRSAN